MKRDKLIFWISTGLFTALMLFSASMYIFSNEMAQENFKALGYPAFLIYPLATAKILGLIAIWTRRSVVLKEWAYAGFLFNALLAMQAHIVAGDGEAGGAIVALVLLAVSYWSQNRVFE